MIPIGVPPEGASRCGRQRGCGRCARCGASVTAPHKLAAFALCDRLTGCGARDRCGQLACSSTATRSSATTPHSAGFAVMGCERAGRLHRRVTRGVARRGWCGARGRARARGLRDRRAATGGLGTDDAVGRASRPRSRADLVVDCTSMALGTDESQLLPLEHRSRPHAWVASLVYHHKAPLLVRAEAAGHRILDGRAMLVHQGARAFEDLDRSRSSCRRDAFRALGRSLRETLAAGAEHVAHPRCRRWRCQRFPAR